MFDICSVAEGLLYLVEGMALEFFRCELEISWQMRPFVILNSKVQFHTGIHFAYLLL